MKKNCGLVWLRNDLRIRDNITLWKAAQLSGPPYVAFCLDERLFHPTPIGIPRLGPHRFAFLLASLRDLNTTIQKLGGELIFLRGNPQTEIPKLAKKLAVDTVFVSAEVAPYECADENQVEKSLWNNEITLERIWQSTLVSPQDLPFPIHNLPNIFTQFRKLVEKPLVVRQEAPSVKRLAMPPLSTPIPSIAELIPSGQRVVEDLRFAGGEKAGLARVQDYFWEEDRLKEYKVTRNGLLGDSYSSKLSPWLAIGCISPRTIYFEVRKYEQQRVKNDSTYWLIFELLWRDYFRWVAKKFGSSLFHMQGIKREMPDAPMKQDERLFMRWCQGNTGIPFIDANMRELALTGFMSNRGRQNVASFLVKDLGLDWRWGAWWFEYSLLDYDVASNWGNWCYIAGVGNDPRENRYFNIINQAKRYDANGDYVRQWVPELKQLEGKQIHDPFTEDHRIKNLSYPTPIVHLNP